jgi:hypothetical protein
MAVLGLLAGLLIVEGLVRFLKPTPAAQIVRGHGLHRIGDVPVWEFSTDRYNRECVVQHPERRRVLFFGSSITFGSGLRADETFTTALEARLNRDQPTPGFCVLNFAQSGFSFEQKYAVARIEVARYRPVLIMWEDWVEWMDYTLIGETAYGTYGYRIRPDGSIGMAGIPDALNRALLLHSRSYEYLTLIAGEGAPRPAWIEEARAFAATRLPRVVQLAHDLHAKLVLYPSPPLDRPFSETAASLPDWHAIVVDFGHANGVPVYPLQRELINEDYLRVRQDSCCHYNAEGHRALVPVMERIILEHLGPLPHVDQP